MIKKLLLIVFLLLSATPAYCATRTISDAGGNANATTAWVEGIVPVAADDVVATATSGNLVWNIYSDIHSFDLTGYTGILSGTGDIAIKVSSGTANCKFAGTVTWTDGTLALKAASGATINLYTNGLSLKPYYIDIGGAGYTGTVNFQDAVDISTNWGHIRDYSNLNTNGFSVNVYKFTPNFSQAGTLDITNSTITLTVGYSAWDASTNSANLTLTSTGSTIVIGGGNNSFKGGGKTYNTVTFSGDITTITGNNTFTTLNVNQAGNATGLKFTAGSIQTVTNFTTNGYASNLAKILSDTAGTHFHLTTASAQISVDYMSIKDSVADQANVWYAGANSTDVSGNSGWVFTAPPLGPHTTVKLNGNVQLNWNVKLN